MAENLTSSSTGGNGTPVPDTATWDEANGQAQEAKNGVHPQEGREGNMVSPETSRHEEGKDWKSATPAAQPVSEVIAARRAEALAHATRLAEATAARRAESLARVTTPSGTEAASVASVPGAAESPRRRRGTKKWSALFFIGLPTLIAAIYYGHFASDQYVALADFTISSSQSGGSKSSSSISSLMGGGGGAGGMATIVYQFIVRNYVNSLQIIQDIKPHLDLRKIYSNPSADAWSRLDTRKPVTDEQLLAYWNSMVSVNFDMTTGLSEIKVRAFTPEDAKAVADLVLQLSEGLVNRLSDRARADALRLSQQEVDLAYSRAVKARDALSAYSQTSQQISPDGLIKSRAGIQATLDSDLVASQSELELLRKSLPEDAPGIQQIKKRIGVIQTQLAGEKVRSTSFQGGISPNEIISTFSKLQMENDFATQAYMSALTYRESAQVESLSQACYLEAYVRPQLPQFSQYPARLQSVFLVALVSAVVWAIGSLLVAAIKEH